MSSDKGRICRRMLLVALVALPAAGCFQPLYGERRDGTPGVRERLLGVDLPPVVTRDGSREQRLGVEIRNALAFRLYGSATGLPPTHQLVMTLNTSKTSLIVDPITALPSIENYGIDATYRLVEVATQKVVLTGSTFSRVSYDIPGNFQRFARSRALRDAEDRASQEIADNIQTRLASYFYAPI